MKNKSVLFTSIAIAATVAVVSLGAAVATAVPSFAHGSGGASGGGMMGGHGMMMGKKGHMGGHMSGHMGGHMGGHATQAVNGGASLKVNGGNENTFVNCTIGVDTIAAATGMMGVRVDTAARRIIFKNCHFTMYAGHAGCGFVEVVDSAGFDRYLIFDNCLFINDAVGFTMASAFVIPGGMGSATHRIILKDCMGIGITDWDASNRGLMYLGNGTITGGGNSGLGVVSNAT